MNDLKAGDAIVIEGVPHEVLSVAHSHFGRGGSVVEARLKNLKTGAVFVKNFKPADILEEADIKKEKLQFLYSHRGAYWFQKPDEPKSRFQLPENVVSSAAKFLTSGMLVEAIRFGEEIISIKPPIKADYKVIEAPPPIRGNTAQGGTKIVKIETGAELSSPLFIEEGDIIRVNTETEEYVERIEKSKES